MTNRGSTLIHAPAKERLHFDDNGITGPDWGRSELVFTISAQKEFAPDILSLTVQKQLLFSSTLFSCLHANLAEATVKHYNTLNPFVKSVRHTRKKGAGPFGPAPRLR